MTEEIEKRLAELERRVTEAERELVMWRNLQVAPESGGGSVTLGRDAVFLRLNSLTASSAQTP